MIEYILLILVPALLSPLKIKTKKTSYAIVGLGVFFVYFIALLSLRGIDVGSDTRIYYQKFIMIDSIPFKNMWNQFGMDTGYYIFTKIAKNIAFGNWHLFLLINAVIALSPIWIFYSKEAKHQYFCISIFIAVAPFAMYFSGMRQIIAMAFAIPSWYFAKERKIVPFILFVVFAFFIHTSALVMIVMYPLYSARFIKRSLLYIIPIITAIFVFNKQIFTFLIQFMGDTYSTRYSDMTSTGAYLMLVLFVLFAIFTYIIPIKNIDNDTMGLRNIMLLIVVIQSFASISTIAMRMNYYFLPFVPILLDKIITQSKKELKYISIFSLYVFSIFFTAYFLYKGFTESSQLNIYPYIPFWESTI